MMIPIQTFSHARPVVGLGNFSLKYVLSESMVDPSVVEHKFALWDEHGSSDMSLLKDKTIMAYALLRLDGTPVRLYPVQDAVLSDGHDRIVFAGANQVIGKSVCLNIDAATEFLTDHGKGWVGILVSGSLPQSQYQMDRIKSLLRSSKISYRDESTVESKTGRKDNTTQISYTFYADDGRTPKYSNLLICCPHTSSALGYPANHVWLDEADWWENCDYDHFLRQVVIPRTFRTGGKVKVYSNPNGRERLLWKLWNEVDSLGMPVWHRYHFNYWDSPGASQEGFDRLRVGLSKMQVESTLLAVFTRMEGSFFSQEEIKDMVCPELSQKGDMAGYGRQTAWFLDVGSVHDQSVLVGGYLEENKELPDVPLVKVFWIHKYPVGYPLGRVVGSESPDAPDGWAGYAGDNPSVKEVLERYSEEAYGKRFQPLFGFDATGNAGMLPLLSAVGIEAVGITFSGKLKWHMYQRLQYYVQQRFIKRALERDDNTVGGRDLDHQFSRLVVKKNTMTSYRQIHHESEDDLDDVCFVAGTPVVTDKGEVPIEEIGVGDMVLTRHGFQKVLGTSCREAIVISRFGMTATPNHPFFTKDGIKRFKNIKASDVVYKWNARQSIIEEGTITDTLGQRNGICEFITGLTGAIKHHLLCIGRFGEAIMEKSQKITSFIIKTVIPSTTTSPILSVCISQNTRGCTPLNQNGLSRQDETLKSQEWLRVNGTGRKKEGNGIKNTIKKLQKNCIGRSSPTSVLSAKKHSCQQERRGQDSARNRARTKAGGQGKESRKYANNARLFSLPPTGRQSIAERRVQVLRKKGRKEKNLFVVCVFNAISRFILSKPMGNFVQRLARQDGITSTAVVYNMAVENYPEFFAHGILVHNCDSVAGLINVLEDPESPTLSFDIIDDGKSVLADVEAEAKDGLDGQYIPSFYDKGELRDWIGQKEQTYH